MQEGDFITIPADEGQHDVWRLLRIDPMPDGTETFHCTYFEPVEEVPEAEDLSDLKVFAHHVPIDSEKIRENGRVIGHAEVTEDDLFGFRHYLKLTDFPRYLEETGQELEKVVEEALVHYREGCRLDELEQHRESLEEYAKAIEIYPLLYEAYDNRGFAFMDLDDFGAAAAEFQQSLERNPDNHTAFFSLGECCWKLGRAADARRIFREGMERWPDEPMFAEFLERMDSPAGRKKAWWRFW